MEGVTESEEIAIAPAEVKTFPKQPKDQLAAIRDLLRTSNNPWTIAQIAAQFKNGSKNKSAISENLERLEWFGILYCYEDGQIRYWQNIETQQAGKMRSQLVSKFPSPNQQSPHRNHPT